MSTRLRIDLGYLGTAFSGWAIQPGLRTIQGSLEDALATALRCDRGGITAVVAGRTDAGVHALHQVCHVDVPDGVKWGNLETLKKRVQGTLRTDDIAIHRISLAPEGFEARFSALSRTYEYRIDDVGSKIDTAMAERDYSRRELTEQIDAKLERLENRILRFAFTLAASGTTLGLAVWRLML